VNEDKHKLDEIGAISSSVIASLARVLNIPLPKNNDYKSKIFLMQSKEKISTLLFNCLNSSNEIDLQFKREGFQHYKGYIGRGNNPSLFFQLFKSTRWWWQLYSTLPKEKSHKEQSENKEGSHANQNGYQACPWEDFKEHNFIWTQWKKMRNF